MLEYTTLAVVLTVTVAIIALVCMPIVFVMSRFGLISKQKSTKLIPRFLELAALSSFGGFLTFLFYALTMKQ